jgi:hypothetical protein
MMRMITMSVMPPNVPGPPLRRNAPRYSVNMIV